MNAPLRIAAFCFVALLGSLTWAQAGNYRDARACYSDTLELNPSSRLAHDNLGILPTHEGKLEQAAARYRDAMWLRPHDAETRAYMGCALTGSGRYPEALREGLNNQDMRNKMAVALDEMGQADEARAQLDEGRRLLAAAGGR
jgi:Tfp pilus assembly protein PilF